MRPALSIGIPTHEDVLGLWPTIQSIRLMHKEVMSQTEILVIDQSPDTAHGKTTKDFMTWVHGDVHSARYVAAPDPPGSAPAKERVFREAQGEVVVCIDSHVLLWEQSLDRLLDYFNGHPDSRDLLAGPMVYDHLQGGATHLHDEWSSEQWGTWAEAKRCACGAACEIEVKAGRLAIRNPDYRTPAGNACWQCGKEITPVNGKTLDDSIRDAGFTSMVQDNGDPFPIWAHGTGLLACRKDAWPGFAPGMRGFGAEEVLIHEKFRKGGAQVLCAPWMRWTHRFLRPEGPKYRLDRFDKVRNFVLGFKDVGLDLQPVYDHFIKPGLLSEAHWQAILGGKESAPVTKLEQKAGSPACGTCGTFVAPESLEAWYQKAAATPHDINEHCGTLRDLAGKCEHVTDMGSRPGISTVALLAGVKGRMVSYAPQKYAEADALTKFGEGRFEFRQGGSLAVEIEPTDLLFLDTDPHTADHVYAEITRHAAKVSRYLIFHDTSIFAERGSDGGPGVLPALRRWMREHPEWSVIRHDTNNNGLTVLSKDPADKPALPGMLRMSWNYAKALATHVATGRKTLPEVEIEKRLEVCLTCPHRVDNRCTVCGCFLDSDPNGSEGKTLWAESECPLGKWPLPQVGQ